MMTNTSVLAQIERTERQYKLAFLAAVAVEAVLLAALLLGLNLKDRTHLMLLIGFVGSYSIVVLAIVALGLHVSKVGQRIIRAIEAGSKQV